MEKSPEAFRTISEVAEVLKTPTHVLRFWETRFTQVRPVKRAGGRRYYRPSDVALLEGIRFLLHDQGMTIRGVQKVLREQGVRHVCSLAKLDFAGEVEAEWEAQDASPIVPSGFATPTVVEAEVIEISAERALRRDVAVAAPDDSLARTDHGRDTDGDPDATDAWAAEVDPSEILPSQDDVEPSETAPADLGAAATAPLRDAPAAFTLTPPPASFGTYSPSRAAEDQPVEPALSSLPLFLGEPEPDEPLLPFVAEEIEAEDIDVVEDAEPFGVWTDPATREPEAAGRLMTERHDGHPQSERAAVYSLGQGGISPGEAARELALYLGLPSSARAKDHAADLRASEEVLVPESATEISESLAEISPQLAPTAESFATEGMEDSPIPADSDLKDGNSASADEDLLAKTEEECLLAAAEETFSRAVDLAGLRRRLMSVFPCDIDRDGLIEVADKLWQLRENILSDA